MNFKVGDRVVTTLGEFGTIESIDLSEPDGYEMCIFLDKDNGSILVTPKGNSYSDYEDAYIRHLTPLEELL